MYFMVSLNMAMRPPQVMLAAISDKGSYPHLTLLGPVLRELGSWLGPEGSLGSPQFQVESDEGEMLVIMYR